MVIPLEILNMVAEYTSSHNDGYTQQCYREELEELRDYLIEVLNDSEAKT